MPNWGLSEELAETKPWGLDRRYLLPDKTNTDPIHEAIQINHLERRIVDSAAFQRLRRVRQLGTTHLVYPGATHTRFQHSLGALKVVQDLFDGLLANPVSHRLGDDLLTEWRSRPDYRKRVAEALVLARLGALLHDFCHVPYGHTVEDDFELLTPHDKNTDRFNSFWSTIDAETRGAIAPALKDELEILILSKRENTRSRYPFVADLVGNTVCADLIDYLWRDYYFTGLPGRLGKRFLSYFFVTPSTTPDFPERMSLRIVKNGRLRADVITEVFKYLRYRYELGERVLQHHAKVAADVMVARSFAIWIERAGVERVEAAICYYGDDGLLEYLSKERIEGASDLASAVLERRLYKEIRSAKSENTYLRKDALYEKYKKAAARRALEENCARYIGLSKPWHVLLSIPDPKMRLKAADVLVSTGPVITRLRAWDEEHGKRAADLYESHRRLWAVQLFVHPSIGEPDRERIAAYMAQELGVSWDAAPIYDTTPPVVDQALSELAREHKLDAGRLTELREAAHRTVGAGAETYGDLKSRLERLLDAPEEPQGSADPEGKSDAAATKARKPKLGKDPKQGKLV
jgi:uncharacterized protein